jgi:hypothetical protein
VFELDGILRLEEIAVMLRERVESDGVFAFDDDGFGAESVMEAVAGGGQFAFRGDRAVRFGAVAARCEVLEFGAHGFLPGDSRAWAWEEWGWEWFCLQ